MDDPGFPSLFELLPIGAYRSSTGGRQLRANAALVRLNGYDSEAEMLGAVNDIALEWYVDPQRRDQFKQLMERDGQVVDFVSEIYRHKSRERIWIRENAHVVRDADGSVRCFEGTVEDITGQRRTQLALEASERRFRALTERAQVLTLVCDVSGAVLYASPAARQVLGVAPEAMRGQAALDWVHRDDVALVRSEMARVAVTPVNTGGESIVRVRHADGSWRHLAALANNCLADPAVGGIVLNLRDVTERQQAIQALQVLNAELEERVERRTAELERARDEAETANRVKSDFLSRMSHELRTPMNAILGFAQLLDTEPAHALSPRQRGHAQQILRAGAHLLELIDDVLDLARIEAGRLRMSFEPVNVPALLAECVALMQPTAHDEAVQLGELPASGCDCFVAADRTRLKQVLLNLISNAIKYNRHGGSVHFACSDGGANAPGTMRIDVTDTGPGLAPAQAARLFRSFERLDAQDGIVQGAGIGLALSKRLVELMHGEIGLDSEVGVGSTFWVRLAHARPDTFALHQPPARAVAVRPAADKAARTFSVLYIEDNPVNVLLMEGLLGQLDCVRMRSAELPDLGLDMARRERPDLILLDIRLPGIDGYEVLRRLRSDEATRHIPVIAVSANAMRSDVERGTAAGFTDYLTKPLDLQQTLAAVQRALPR